MNRITAAVIEQHKTLLAADLTDTERFVVAMNVAAMFAVVEPDCDVVAFAEVAADTFNKQREALRDALEARR